MLLLTRLRAKRIRRRHSAAIAIARKPIAAIAIVVVVVIARVHVKALFDLLVNHLFVDDLFLLKPATVVASLSLWLWILVRAEIVGAVRIGRRVEQRHCDDGGGDQIIRESRKCKQTRTQVRKLKF